MLQLQIQIAEDLGFRKRLRQALIQEAITIFGEDGATTNHANRLLLAKDVLRGNADAHVARLVYVLPTFPVIETAGATVDDATLQTTLAAVIDPYTQVMV